jgi:hypothetical protein
MGNAVGPPDRAVGTIEGLGVKVGGTEVAVSASGRLVNVEVGCEVSGYWVGVELEVCAGTMVCSGCERRTTKRPGKPQGIEPI